METLRDFRETRNRVTLEIKLIKSFKLLTSNIEHDFYSTNKKIWGVIRRCKFIQTKTIMTTE